MTETTSTAQPPQTLTNESDLYKHVLDHMLDVITIIDEAGLIRYQSKSIHRMLGHSPEAMLGEEVSEYVHPNDLTLVVTAIDQLLSGAVATNQLEFRFRHHDGEYRRVHAVGRAWEKAGIRGVLVNSRDITEAHEAQVELAKQNELLEKTFAVSKNALSISRPASGELLKVNDAWCEMLGHKRENALGKSALSLGIWGQSEYREQVLSAFEREGRLQNYEAKAYTATGEERLIVIDAQLLLVADQPRLLMSTTDVTDSRKTEEDLRQSQKMEAIGQLTGGVAHDFNNLIGVTMGNAELLLDLVADQPDAYAHAEQILSAAERGATLTHQLLAFSRKQNLAPEPIDALQHLLDARSLLQTSVSENTVIDIVSEPELWRCQVDPNQLQNALLNLTLNSHDAMPNGGLLRFRVSNFTAIGNEKGVNGCSVIGALSAGEYVALTISDTGCGMDTQTKSRAFEPFFSTKDSERGTGLGLPMVFGFVEQSGGTLCLDSKTNKGTTLILLLPRSTSAEESALANKDAAAPPIRLPAEEPRTVLIVEDNDALRSVLVEALGAMGYVVLEAAGEEELHHLLIHAAEIDLLLCDVILKESKRGPEIARQVCSQFPDAVVLLMTGFSPTDVLQNTDYPVLMKPFTLVELSRVVRTMLFAAHATGAQRQ